MDPSDTYYKIALDENEHKIGIIAASQGLFGVSRLPQGLKTLHSTTKTALSEFSKESTV